MTNYILIDSKTRAPVPLPYATQAPDGTPVNIMGFYDRGEVSVRNERTMSRYRQPPQMFGLELITEADFMAERA